LHRAFSVRRFFSKPPDFAETVQILKLMIQKAEYEREHGRRLRFILRARDLGFGIEDIRGLLKLVDRRAYTCAQVREMTLEHLDAVRLKIADLRRLERTLAKTVAACNGRNVPDCPVIDALASN